MMVFKICLFIKQHFIHQKLKKQRHKDYVIGWKSKCLFEYKLIPLNGASFPNIKYFRYKIGIHFNKTPMLPLFTIQIIGQQVPSQITFENCLFGTTNIAKKSDKKIHAQWLWNSI